MKNVFIVPLCLSLFAIGGCSSDDGDWGYYECDNTQTPGYATFDDNGNTREYLLHVPASYTGDTAVPLVLNFHGNGGCATYFSSPESGDLSEIADAAGFLVAYPQGVARAKGDTEWNPADDGSDNIMTNDLVFTEKLIDAIAADYNVDRTRVYAAGYSNGGMMSYGLACQRGDLIAAAGIMSGVMLPDTCNTEHKTPILHFHGTDDYVLPLDGGGVFPSVTSGIDFWVAHNNIDPGNVQTAQLNGGEVTRDVYTGGDEGSTVTLYTLEDGDHIWFQDSIDGVSTNQILWDFFAQYEESGLIQ